MPFRPLSRLGARLLSIVLLAGCARDAASPLEPNATIPQKPSAALLGLLPVRGVTRNAALAKDISVSAVIGKAGGTLTIPDAGLTLVVPAGAVTSNTKFTATALAGRVVAYEFEPHGTRFATPLQLTQDLRKVSLLAALTSPLMDGAYFTDRSNVNQALGLALVSELLPATVDLLHSRVTFPIKHFSGYLVSWH
jgi:ZU5 domain-containing protein